MQKKPNLPTTNKHLLEERNRCLFKQYIGNSVIYAMTVKIKRVYEAPGEEDGQRILVDRLWPRGLTKDKAKVDLWMKNIAPTTVLRKWFGHDPEKWEEFKKRYFDELKKNKEQVSLLKEEIKKGPVSLIYGAKDKDHNEALVLRDLLNKL